MAILTGPANFVLNYSRNVYERKISELDGCINRLNAHRANLENYRDKVKNYWDDDNAQQYYNILSKQIKAVMNATNRAISLKNNYSNVVSGLESEKSKITGLLDEMDIKLSDLGIGDD